MDDRRASNPRTLEAEVCVIGAGPVGLALTHALGRAGIRVALIESGLDASDARAQRLNAGDAIGDPYRELRQSRHRGIGGTANIWNTEVGGRAVAKYVPLDPIDFEARDWIPFSGWPFGRAELDPYYRRANELAGLGPFVYEPAAVRVDAAAPAVAAPADRVERSAGAPAPRPPLPLDLTATGMVNRLYRFGDAERFTRTVPAWLNDAPAVTILRGATAIEPEWAGGGDRLVAVRWVEGSAADGHGTVRATRFVLAAGCIENARLLMLWSRGGPAAPKDSGTRSRGPDLGDWLGRGFMEHPIDGSLDLVTSVDALCERGGFYVPHDAGDLRLAVMGRLAPSSELLHACRLPNASVRLAPIDAPATSATRRLAAAARRFVPAGPLRRRLGRFARAVRPAPGLTARPTDVHYRVMIDLEQAPHRDNRIVLSPRRDAVGLPRPELHWSWREHEQSLRERILDTVARELDAAHAGRIGYLAPGHFDPNAHHHAGTTRMHADPRLGVVDETLRVHAVENLFVVGSSVFPTAGAANPTLTAIALALRLADHLAAAT